MFMPQRSAQIRISTSVKSDLTKCNKSLDLPPFQVNKCINQQSDRDRGFDAQMEIICSLFLISDFVFRETAEMFDGSPCPMIRKRNKEGASFWGSVVRLRWMFVHRSCGTYQIHRVFTCSWCHKSNQPIISCVLQVCLTLELGMWEETPAAGMTRWEHDHPLRSQMSAAAAILTEMFTHSSFFLLLHEIVSVIYIIAMKTFPVNVWQK